MADNKTPSSDPTVRTDEIAGVDYQIVKLADGTADSTTVISSDVGPKANALRFAPASDITDATYIGDIKFGEPEPNSTAIKTAVELIDDTVYTDGAGTPSKAIGVAGTDGTNPQIIKTDTNGELQVDVLTSALPTGAATAANQSTANTSLASLEAKIGEVQASPTANTILDRLKALLTGIVLSAGSAIIGKVGIDQTTPGTTNGVQINAALPAGTNAIGKLAANSGVDIGDVDVTSIAAGANLIGNVGIGVRTSGGTTPYYNNGTCTKTEIKGSGGQLYMISCINVKTSVVYLQLFNALAANVTLGTTVPTNEWAIPTQAATVNGAGFVLVIPNGLAYGTGISFAITTTKGGATPATANDALLNIGYA